MAQILGLNSYEKYTQWKTQGYKPDSEELRYEVIKLKIKGISAMSITAKEDSPDFKGGLKLAGINGVLRFMDI